MKILKKMQKRFFMYIILIIIIPNYLKMFYLISSSSQSKINYIEKYSNIDLSSEMLMHFFKQPQYRESSIICFLKHTYNHNFYAEKFLSLNFSHVITLLEYANRTTLPRKYIYNVLSLFNQKLGETTYINSYAFLELLEKLPKLLKPYFDIKKEKEEAIGAIKEELYFLLTDKFELLKENPEKIMDDFSVSVYNLLYDKGYKSNNLDLSVSDIQQELMLFLSTIISKLIWSPKDQKFIWNSVKQISKVVESLLFSKILMNVDNADKLFWTLITRFSYFLSTHGDLLSLDCYQEINKDLEDKNLLFLNLEEREICITSKLNYLKNSLYNSEFKARMYQKTVN